MATRKTTTKKAVAKEVETVATEVEAVVDIAEPKTETKKVFSDSDKIMCRSVTKAPLYMIGVRTKDVYEWLDYGDEIPVKYADLAAEVRRRSAFVFNPYFVITDEDFCAEFPQLDKFYNERFTVRELRDILDMDERDMVAAIEELPDGAKESLKAIAADAVKDGVIDSVRKIRVLDEKLGIDLNLLADLFQQ